MWKRKWILLGMWLISLWIISHYGGTASYGLFFGITMIPLLSLIYSLCVFVQFRIYQKIESRDIICRQSVPYYFVLQNENHYGFASVKARMFSTLSYVEDIPDDMEYELLPGDRYTYETRLVCQYRGEYEVGIKEVVVTDFFRLFTFKYRTTETIKALVKPRMLHLDELNSIQDIVAFVQRENPYSDSEPDIVVRDYIDGDSMAHIHWKATAKEQKLKVRTRTGEDKQMICIFYDTKRYVKDLLDYLPPENQILETTLALGLFLAEKNINYTLLQSSVKTVRGLRDYEELYKIVADTQFTPEADIQLELQSVLHQSMTNHCKILFGVMQSLTTDTLIQFESCLSQGTVVVLYVITDENMDELLKQGNERLRIIPVPINAELKDIL